MQNTSIHSFWIVIQILCKLIQIRPRYYHYFFSSTITCTHRIELCSIIHLMQFNLQENVIDMYLTGVQLDKNASLPNYTIVAQFMFLPSEK